MLFFNITNSVVFVGFYQGMFRNKPSLCRKRLFNEIESKKLAEDFFYEVETINSTIFKKSSHETTNITQSPQRKWTESIQTKKNSKAIE